MKLLTYKIDKLEANQIGILQDGIVYNLNNCFGNISIVDLIQIENYGGGVIIYQGSKNSWGK